MDSCRSRRERIGQMPVELGLAADGLATWICGRQAGEPASLRLSDSIERSIEVFESRISRSQVGVRAYEISPSG